MTGPNTATLMMLLERFLLPPAQTSPITVCLIGLAGLIGLVAAAGYGFSRWMLRRRLGSWLYLFGELCRAHGLQPKDIGLLRRIAAKHGLPRLDTLFVDSTLFDRLIDPPDSDFRLDDVVRLRERLFRGEAESIDDTSIKTAK